MWRRLSWRSPRAGPWQRRPGPSPRVGCRAGNRDPRGRDRERCSSANPTVTIAARTAYFYQRPRPPAAVTMAPAQGFPSGQRGRAVNPLAQPSEVRILSPALSASAGSARADPARGVRPSGGKIPEAACRFAAAGTTPPCTSASAHPLAQPPAGPALRAGRPLKPPAASRRRSPTRLAREGGYTQPLALLAQLVEHLHGKEGVNGSSPLEGLKKPPGNGRFFCFLDPRADEVRNRHRLVCAHLCFFAANQSVDPVSRSRLITFAYTSSAIDALVCPICPHHNCGAGPGLVHERGEGPARRVVGQADDRSVPLLHGSPVRPLDGRSERSGPHFVAVARRAVPRRENEIGSSPEPERPLTVAAGLWGVIVRVDALAAN